MGARDEYIAIMKSAFVSIFKKVAMDSLVAASPKLFSGVLGTIFSPVASLFIDFILKAAVTNGEAGAFFIYIDARTGKQSEEFQNLAYQNYNIQKTGTKDEKLAIEKKLKESFIKFASLTY